MVLGIGDRGRGGGDRQPVQVVNVLDDVERGDQVGAAEREADAHAGQRVRLRHRAQDHQVVVAREEVESGLGREVDVGLVEHDHASRGSDYRLDQLARVPGPGR